MTAPNVETRSLVTQVGDGNPDGTSLSPAGGKASVYGETPVAQQATTLGADLATTVAISTTTTKWGFATSTQANDLVTMVNDLRTALVNFGILSA